MASLSDRWMVNGWSLEVELWTVNGNYLTLIKTRVNLVCVSVRVVIYHMEPLQMWDNI